MSKQPATPEPIQETAIIPNQFNLDIDKTKETVKLSSILAEMGISGPRIPAESLIDQTFVIRAAKAFQSSYQEQAHAYFCVIAMVDTGEVLTSVLGGQAVVDIIDSLCAAGLDSPLEVTLRYKAGGGRFSGYYYLE